jgi:hypothetical protein
MGTYRYPGHYQVLVVGQTLMNLLKLFAQQRTTSAARWPLAIFSVQRTGVAGLVPTPVAKMPLTAITVTQIIASPISMPQKPSTVMPETRAIIGIINANEAISTATLCLCRATSSPGIDADAGILAEIDATLKQFSNIKNVVVLTQAGHCFADVSGQDRCLK